MNGRATTWGVFKSYAFFFSFANCDVSRLKTRHHKPYVLVSLRFTPGSAEKDVDEIARKSQLRAAAFS